jgi:hypothetical protein
LSDCAAITAELRACARNRKLSDHWVEPVAIVRRADRSLPNDPSDAHEGWSQNRDPLARSTGKGAGNGLLTRCVHTAHLELFF